MFTRHIPRSDWKDFFDTVSRTHPGKQVVIEIIRMELGAQPEEEWALLNGVSYDPNDDACYIFTNIIKHFIHHPTRIFSLEEGTNIRSIEIVDDEGTRQIIMLKDPIGLPPSLF